MISTKFRKEQKARKKARAIGKLKETKKTKLVGDKKSHKMRMQRRNEKLKQKMLFRIAERKRQIEKLKAIIEENKLKKLAEEMGVSQEPIENEIGEVYQGLLNRPSEEEKHTGPGFYEFIDTGNKADEEE